MSNGLKIALIVFAAVVALVMVVLVVGAVFLSKTEYWHPVLTKLKLKKYANEEVYGGNVVFLGDSITDYCDLKKWYPEFTAYNRGISGDRTEDVLQRMESVYDAKPSVVVLLVGVNDIVFYNQEPDDIIARYRVITDELQRFCPGVKIICQSVYPTNDVKKKQYVAFNDSIVVLNAKIKELCEEKGFVYVDVHGALCDEQGRLNLGYSDDGLHPNDMGYKAISDLVKPHILNALGLD